MWWCAGGVVNEMMERGRSGAGATGPDRNGESGGQIRPPTDDAQATRLTPSGDITTAHGPLPATASEAYRELCEDEDGARYTVIVWRLRPGQAGVAYTLEDGSPVTYDDSCRFTVIDTGRELSRCDL